MEHKKQYFVKLRPQEALPQGNVTKTMTENRDEPISKSLLTYLYNLHITFQFLEIQNWLLVLFESLEEKERTFYR